MHIQGKEIVLDKEVKYMKILTVNSKLWEVCTKKLNK